MELEKIKDLKYGELATPFFKAVTYSKMIENAWDEFYSNKFHFYLDEVIKKARNKIKEKGNDSWVYFYLGASYGLRALYQVRSRDYWSSFFTSRRMRKELKKALRLDPTIYDVYYAFGLQNYYLAYFTRFVPFLGGRMEKAIRELKIASEFGVYSKIDAKIGLAQAYFMEKRFDEALDLYQQIRGIYPKIECTYFWSGVIYYEQGRLDEAERCFENLLSFAKPGNIYRNQSKTWLDKISQARKKILLELEDEDIH